MLLVVSELFWNEEQLWPNVCDVAHGYVKWPENKNGLDLELRKIGKSNIPYGIVRAGPENKMVAELRKMCEIKGKWSYVRCYVHMFWVKWMLRTVKSGPKSIYVRCHSPNNK